MRNLIFIVIIIFFSNSVNAQITLEHTFSGELGTYSVNTNNQTMYFNFNQSTGVLNLYNSDYSLYKSIIITPPSGYQFNSTFCLSDLQNTISTKIFNTDDLVEFAVCFQSMGSPTNYKLLLYDENLQVLKDFGERLTIWIFRTMNDQTKCFVNGSIISGSQVIFYQDIYHLPGNLPVDVDNEFSSTYEPLPFPNPTNTYIVIPLSLGENETTILNIFNQNGEIIESRGISGLENTLNIDVQRYSPGLYFYQYNNVTEKFIVAK